MVKRILVADDDADILDVLGLRLKATGYSVALAKDGAACLERFAAEKPDLLIVDIMMPVTNGWEVCKEIKNNPKTKDTPVIILTAKSQDIDALMSYECGAD